MGTGLYFELLQRIEESEKVIETQSKLISTLLSEQLEKCNYCLMQEVKDGLKSN